MATSIPGLEDLVQATVAQNSNDLLNRMDSLITSRFEGLKSELTSQQRQHTEQQVAAINSLQSTEEYVFKKKGNEEQFVCNRRALSHLYAAQHAIEWPDIPQEANKELQQGIEVLQHRQKLIKLADSSDLGWRVVNEYETHQLAEDSDDEKRILKAEYRAGQKQKNSLKKRNSRFSPYSRPTTTCQPNQQSSSNHLPGRNERSRDPSRRSGTCFACGKFGHWRGDQACEANGTRATQKISNNNYSIGIGGMPDVCNDRVPAREECPHEPAGCKNDNVSTVGRLKSAYNMWKASGANSYVLDIIENGYKIPFFDTPSKAEFKNNMSSRKHPDFVQNEIQNLLARGCISEVCDRPIVINPLTVSENQSGKLRLILDCRYINLFLYKFKFKLEDISVARQMVSQGDYLFKFDLKSAYHQIEINKLHRTYLGFSWPCGNNMRFFVFNVLPFGISTAPYIFTKVTRVMVKFCREKGHKVVMYIDDGMGGAADQTVAEILSNEIRTDIQKFGFLESTDKCQWTVSQEVIFLGCVLDTVNGKISVTNERFDKLVATANGFVARCEQGMRLIIVKKLAACVGLIISTMAVTRQVARMRTRFLHCCINTNANWHAYVYITDDALEELRFWACLSVEMNKSDLIHRELCTKVVFSDASGGGYGGYIVSQDDSEVIGHWSEDERSKSSTWRELVAVRRVLLSSLPCLEGHCIKWYSDNNNVVIILQAGSKVKELQLVALQIAALCVENNMCIEPAWVPRRENQKADCLSRSWDRDDWGISHGTFVDLNMACGPFTVDRFANNDNDKCQLFNSRWWCEGTESVDTFAAEWQGEIGWSLLLDWL